MVVRAIGITIVVLAAFTIIAGVIVLATSEPRCILPVLGFTTAADASECALQSKRRNIGITLVISGVLALIAGCFLMLFHRLQKESVLVSAAAAIAAAVASVAAATAANAAAQSGSQRFVTVDPSAVGIARGIVTTTGSFISNQAQAAAAAGPDT